MVKYGHKIEEKVKAMQSEIKENVQENQHPPGKKPELKSMGLDQKEEINIQPEQNEEIRI